MSGSTSLLSASGTLSNNGTLPTSYSGTFSETSNSISLSVTITAIEFIDTIYLQLYPEGGGTNITGFLYESIGADSSHTTTISVSGPLPGTALNETVSSSTAIVNAEFEINEASLMTYNVSCNGSSVSGSYNVSPALSFGQLEINPIFYPNPEMFTFDFDVTTYTPPVPPPSAPTGLTATLYVGAEVELAWTPDTDSTIESLTLWRGAGLGTAFSSCTVLVNTGPGADSYLDTGTSINSSYTYYLTATNAGGRSPPSNAATITTPGSSTIPCWNGVSA